MVANHTIRTKLLMESRRGIGVYINGYHVPRRLSSSGVGGGTTITGAVDTDDSGCNLVSVSADTRLRLLSSARIGVVIYEHKEPAEPGMYTHDHGQMWRTVDRF